MTDLTILCPECNNSIEKPDDLNLGDILECPGCGTECEIINLEPIQLAPLEEEK